MRKYEDPPRKVASLRPASDQPETNAEDRPSATVTSDGPHARRMTVAALASATLRGSAFGLLATTQPGANLASAPSPGPSGPSYLRPPSGYA